MTTDQQGERPELKIVWSFRGEMGERIADAPRLVLGRSRQCDLVFKDESLSRQHAEVVCVDGAWHLRDLKSLNGIFLDGKRATDHALRHGDRFRLVVVSCKVKMKVRSRGADGLAVVLDDAGGGASLSLAPGGAEMSQVDMTMVGARPPDLGWAGPIRTAAETLLTARDLDDVLRRFLELVAGHVGAERGAIGLLKGGGARELEMRAS